MRNTAGQVNNARFGSVVHADIQRSTFKMPSGKKTTFNAGDIVPIYLQEVLPADTFKMDMSFVTRVTTPIVATMDTMDLDFYAFFTPTRLLWTNWQALNGENKTSAWVPSSAPALVPTYAPPSPGVSSGSLCDYMDIPVGTILSNTPISALPLRMYYIIYNEWFRDQNLQAPISVYLDNSNSVAAGLNVRLTGILKANKKHDYFTSALPAPQKGESQLIPIELNELIPIITGANHTLTTSPLLWRKSADGTALAVDNLASYNLKYRQTDVGNGTKADIADATVNGGTDVIPSNLWADGSGMQISGSTISDLRTAFQLQKLYEKDARGGTRYVEMLKSHFGVEAQDYRLQRPEYLGKMSSQVGIHQVAQTSSTDDTSPQGNISAFAYGSGSSSLFNKSFVEHGYVMIVAVARHNKTYQEGIDKMWFRKDRFDFYYPTLANISEQPILNKEIYALGNNGDEIFGYQEAWADYRYKPSKVSGMMRAGAGYDIYHYADHYTSQPVLSASWITDNSKTNLDRTIAVQSTVADQIILDVAFDLTATRPMPVYSIPGMVDHF